MPGEQGTRHRSATAGILTLDNPFQLPRIIINGKVYDVTQFANDHPGGKKILINVAGKDASKQFEAFHNVEKVLKKFGPQLLKGDVAGG
jgi:cytochrome b involved in lipid metabolism